MKQLCSSRIKQWIWGVWVCFEEKACVLAEEAARFTLRSLAYRNLCSYYPDCGFGGAGGVGCCLVVFIEL